MSRLGSGSVLTDEGPEIRVRFCLLDDLSMVCFWLTERGRSSRRLCLRKYVNSIKRVCLTENSKFAFAVFDGITRLF